MRTVEDTLHTLMFLAAAVVAGGFVGLAMIRIWEDFLLGRDLAVGGAFLLGAIGLLVLLAILDTLRKVKEKLNAILVRFEQMKE
jgi:hypothetical protein